MFNIHANARANFNTTADQLTKLIEALPTDLNQGSPFPPDMFPPESLHSSGRITAKQVDYRGRTVARYFWHNSDKFGMTEGNYKILKKLSNRILKIRHINDMLSDEYVEEKIFSWCTEKFSGNTPESFIEYLEAAASTDVRHVKIYVPLAKLFVSEPFEFCGAMICNITESLLDKNIETIRESGGIDEPSLNILNQRIRSEYQGFAAIELAMTCEQSAAFERSIQKASGIASLLAIYSGALILGDVKTMSKVKGTENIESGTTFTLLNNKIFLSTAYLNAAEVTNVEISARDLAGFRSCGLEIISNLYNAETSSNEFQKAVLNMAYLYSKAAFTDDPMEKLIYVLSSLESFLLKNSSEPIQQNLGERMAIATGTTLSERKSILKNVRDVYSLRSNYLHHGISSEELTEINEFLLNAWKFFVSLLNNTRSYTTKNAYLESIDDQKLS